jgi:hypothetical protein
MKYGLPTIFYVWSGGITRTFLCSTKHRSADISGTGKLRRKKGQTPPEEVKQPKCGFEYKKGRGVLIYRTKWQLCILSCLHCEGVSKNIFLHCWYVHFQLLVLHHKITSKKKTGYSNFKINIAQQLLENVQLPEYSVPGRPSASTTPLRLQAKTWAHFPMHIPPTDKKNNPTKGCAVCYSRGVRIEATWQCKRCSVPLHLQECFEIFYTQQSY